MAHTVKGKSKDTQTLIMAAQVLVLIVLVFQLNAINGTLKGSNVVAPSNNGAAVAPTPAPTAPSPQPTAPVIDMAKLLDDDPVKGDANAPVTIIEWSDFECPFCARFYRDTYGQLVSEYIDTGKVKLVFRDFPLSFHQNAQKAAEASECAHEQDKFWEMHDKIFENQATLSLDNLKLWATEIGLDSAKFNECLDTSKYAAETAKDMQDGSAAGIRGTPGFIINGQLISGAQPFSNFKAIIDAELAKV